MRVQSLNVPLCILVIGAVAYRIAGAAPTPSPAAPQAGAGTQPTYFVEHPDHIKPGLPLQGKLVALTNPFEGNTARIGEGAKLFVAYNCLDCHGADGSGAMGPSLQDGRWHFGGTAGEIFESIYEGRPDGMPAWGRRIADDQIWRLVAYVQTLAKGHNVTTEDFTGKTVDRGGR